MTIYAVLNDPRTWKDWFITLFTHTKEVLA